MADQESQPPDITVVDRDDEVVLVAEAKTRPLTQADVDGAAPLLEQAPFVMLADPQVIRVYRGAGPVLEQALLALDTAAVLRAYEPEFGRINVFKEYLVALLESWLRDLAYHWKSATPPGAEVLEAHGIRQRLEGGTTWTDARRPRGQLHRLR